MQLYSLALSRGDRYTKAVNNKATNKLTLHTRIPHTIVTYLKTVTDIVGLVYIS
jgi:hypothetical protein